MIISRVYTIIIGIIIPTYHTWAELQSVWAHPNAINKLPQEFLKALQKFGVYLI